MVSSMNIYATSPASPAAAVATFGQVTATEDQLPADLLQRGLLAISVRPESDL